MPYLVTALIKKCRKEDSKPGRAWCAYKPVKEGSMKETIPQPKGWPKTYETKDKAERGVQMMKTFGGAGIQAGWFVDILLPTVYACYVKNPKIIDSKRRLLSKVNAQVRTFLRTYPEEFSTIQYWCKKFHALKTQANVLRAINKELRENDFVQQAKIVASIYRKINAQGTYAILKAYYGKNKTETALAGLFTSPMGYQGPGQVGIENIENIETVPINQPMMEENVEQPMMEENVEQPEDVIEQTGPNFLCPSCQLKLIQHLATCPFCGQNPLQNLEQPATEEEIQVFEQLQAFLDVKGNSKQSRVIKP